MNKKTRITAFVLIAAAAAIVFLNLRFSGVYYTSGEDLPGEVQETLPVVLAGILITILVVNQVHRREDFRRRKIEEKLFREREFSSALLESVESGVVACDASGKLILFNRTARQWLGADICDIPQDKWPEHYDLYEEDGATLLPVDRVPLVRAYKGEIVRRSRMVIAAKGRPKRDIVAFGYPFYDNNMKLLGAVVVMHDITELKKSQEELRVSEEKFRSIFENTNEGIVVLNRDGTFLFFNRAAAENLGYTIEEFRGLNMAEIEVKESKDDFPAHYDDALSGRRKKFETLQRRKDGSLVNVEVSLSTIKLENGNFVCGIWMDVTDRRRSEEELKRAYEKLQEVQDQLIQSAKMASIGQLAGGIAHELNNPLTGVLNNIQLIKLEAQGKKDYNFNDFKELLDVAEDSALRCTRITSSLLGLAHISKGKFSQLDLNGLIEKVLVVIARELKMGKIDIRTALDPGLVPVIGDEQLLQQVVLGLVSNAKWAVEKQFPGKEGGVITIKTGVNADNKVVLSVCDNGIGIPVENIPRLFDPFFTTKEVGEGTGLGLSLIYSIIKKHEGVINVESQANNGAVFKITFPA